MTTPNDLPSVGTEDALKVADLLPAFEIAGLGKGVAADACAMLCALVSERDELASRVKELTKQNEAQKNEWLSWNEKRAALEKNAARYQFLADALTGDDIHGVLQKAFAHLDHDHAPTREDFDTCIDAALNAPKEQP